MRQHQDRFGRTSGKIAKTRTQLTVASDRLGCSQEETAQMQAEIEEVLAKYMNLDRDLFGLRLDIISRTKQGVQDVKTIQIK